MPPPSGRPRPLLVTGVPRSGTTWLARELAGADGCALTGREPMNPNGRQYKLGGTVQDWVRLTLPTARQLRALRRAYRGLTPRVYGRYGHRQWTAPLPGTRIVVKDPYAMLSVGAVARATGAIPVLVYRHPAAVLSSYRRMGWQPDVASVCAALGDSVPAGSAPAADPVAAMAWFWAVLNDTALTDLAQLDGAVVVAHEELAAGGAAAMQRLYQACGLGGAPSAAATGPDTTGPDTTGPDSTGPTLHRLDRPSGEVAGEWRSRMDPAEVQVLDERAGPTLQRLREQRLRFS